MISLVTQTLTALSTRKNILPGENISIKLLSSSPFKECKNNHNKTSVGEISEKWAIFKNHHCTQQRSHSRGFTSLPETEKATKVSFLNTTTDSHGSNPLNKDVIGRKSNTRTDLAKH